MLLVARFTGLLFLGLSLAFANSSEAAQHNLPKRYIEKQTQETRDACELAFPTPQGPTFFCYVQSVSIVSLPYNGDLNAIATAGNLLINSGTKKGVYTLEGTLTSTTYGQQTYSWQLEVVENQKIWSDPQSYQIESLQILTVSVPGSYLDAKAFVAPDDYKCTTSCDFTPLYLNTLFKNEQKPAGATYSIERTGRGVFEFSADKPGVYVFSMKLKHDPLLVFGTPPIVEDSDWIEVTIFVLSPPPTGW